MRSSSRLMKQQLQNNKNCKISTGTKISQTCSSLKKSVWQKWKFYWSLISNRSLIFFKNWMFRSNMRGWVRNWTIFILKVWCQPSQSIRMLSWHCKVPSFPTLTPLMVRERLRNLNWNSRGLWPLLLELHEFLSEHGVNVVYIIFSLLRWKSSSQVSQPTVTTERKVGAAEWSFWSVPP